MCRRLLALACALGLSTAPAAAQTPPDLTRATLEDLMSITITTATRSAEGVQQAPAHVQVVTAAQIERRGYRSLADLLKDLSEFKVDIGGDPDYPTELTVQGSHSASRVVLLMDGIRISSPTNEPLPILANYPVHAASQIEILYGPASALYGADAFSAVINIVTKNGADSPGLSAGTSAGQYGLFNQTMSYGARIGTTGSLFVAAQVFSDQQPDLSRFYPADYGGMQGQKTGTFNTIFGPMTPTRPVSAVYDIPLSAHSVLASVHLGRFQFSLFENQSRVSTAPSANPDNTVYNDAAFNRNSLLVGSGTYTRAIGRVTTTSTITGSRHELDPQSGYWNTYSNFEKSFKYAYGSSVKGEEQLAWTAGRARLTVGGVWEHFYSIPQTADLNAPVTSRDVPGTILGTNITDDFNKVRYQNSGAYSQMQYDLSSSIEATVGGRADYNTRFGATFNPRLGIVAHAGEATTLKVLYGTAYLAPSPYQEYAHFGSFYSTDGGSTYQSDYWHVANPNLQPQREQTLEVDLLQRLRPFMITASAFYTRLTDVIISDDQDRAYAGTFHGWPVAYIDFAVNEGRNSIYGGTLAATSVHKFGRTGRIEARASVTLADGHVWSDESPDGTLALGGIAPAQFRAGLDIDWRQWSFAPRLSAVSRQRANGYLMTGGVPERPTIDGYTTVDVNIRRRSVFPHVDAFLTIENALDARYRTMNSRAFSNPTELIGAPQNPRRLTVGVDVRLK